MSLQVSRNVVRVLFAGIVCLAVPLHASQPERIVSSAKTAVDYSTLLLQLKSAQVVVLGEIHENPLHHEIRARLIRDLARPQLTVVAEHLTYAKEVDFSLGLLPGLEQAGFEPKAWQWPMHAPLFQSVLNQRLRLIGGNLSREMTVALSRQGVQALPSELRDLLQKATLTPGLQGALEQEIFDGHCGLLPRSATPKMALVQRGRDIAMARVTLDHLPAVLVTGNGHAWLGAGVPQVIKAQRPELAVISVIFSEGDPVDYNRANFFWITPVVQRPDPCEQLKPKAN